MNLMNLTNRLKPHLYFTLPFAVSVSADHAEMYAVFAQSAVCGIARTARMNSTARYFVIIAMKLFHFSHAANLNAITGRLAPV